MAIDPSPVALEEYRALRATIRQRGSVRLIVITLTFVSWSAASLALVFAPEPLAPLSAVFPLAMLAAGFEVAFATHVGVERVGRYLEVFYEEALTVPERRGIPPLWESVIRTAGPALASGGTDPLFARLFTLATGLNLVPALMAGSSAIRAGDSAVLLGLAGVGLLHVALLARVRNAGRFARTQRDGDLAVLRSRRGEGA